MDLNRQTRSVKNEVDLIAKHISELVTECFRLGGQQLSALNQANPATTAEYEAELYDMSKVMDDCLNKIQELRVKST